MRGERTPALPPGGHRTRPPWGWRFWSPQPRLRPRTFLSDPQQLGLDHRVRGAGPRGESSTTASGWSGGPGSPPMSSSAHVSITVLDVNDNDPVFTQPVYRLRHQTMKTQRWELSVLTRPGGAPTSSQAHLQLAGGPAHVTASRQAARAAAASSRWHCHAGLQAGAAVRAGRHRVRGMRCTQQVFINVTDANTTGRNRARTTG